MIVKSSCAKGFSIILNALSVFKLISWMLQLEAIVVGLLKLSDRLRTKQPDHERIAASVRVTYHIKSIRRLY